MDITCIADLHGHFPELPGGDLLIVAGDLTASDTYQQYILFDHWFRAQNYSKKILIAGNHDNLLQTTDAIDDVLYDCDYLCDSGTEFQYSDPVRNLFDSNDRSLIFKRTLKIWGSPWTLRFPGMDPKCMAFTVDTEEELAEKWSLIPDDTEILITHCPPWGIMDEVENYQEGKIESVGSKDLLEMARSLSLLKLFIFGHVHEGYGMITPQQLAQQAVKDAILHSKITKNKSYPYIVNASHVNERYQPVNKPIRIDL